MPDSCLILFPHGSRDPKWREQFERLKSELTRRLGQDRVRLAYQQFVPPTLLDAAETAVRAGIQHLYLLPLFMSVSEATLRDLENQAAVVRERLPEARLVVLPPVSKDPGFKGALLMAAEAAARGVTGPSTAPARQPRVGVGVIIRRHGRVLMGKRRNAHGEGTWSFPGGHLEYGETIAMCAERETLEETGLVVGNTRHAAYTNDLFEKEGKHYITLFVSADLISGDPVNREPDRCDGWEWVSWGNLPEPLFPPVSSLLVQGFRPEHI